MRVFEFDLEYTSNGTFVAMNTLILLGVYVDGIEYIHQREFHRNHDCGIGVRQMIVLCNMYLSVDLVSFTLIVERREVKG